MDILSPKSRTIIYPGSRTLINQEYQTYLNPNNLTNQRSRTSLASASSSINFLQSRLSSKFDPMLINKINNLKHIKSNKPTLVQTQQKIFSQVISLVDEIQNLKTSILQHHEQIQKIQLNYPDVDQRVRYHGYSQKLTPQQCSDLEQQNFQLIKQIQFLQSKQVQSLQDVLNIQKKKYQNLKLQLSGSNSTQNIKKIQDRINQLKNMINTLQGQRFYRIKNQYPQIETLKQQNSILRAKTIQNLRIRALKQQQYNQLVSQIQAEDQSMQSYMVSLQQMKAQAKKLKQQNRILKQKIQKKYNNDFKENKINQGNQSFKTNNSKISKIPSSSKLNQYEAFIKMMQSNY